MNNPLSEPQFKAVKFSAVCSYEAYVRLWQWQQTRFSKYLIEVTKSFYTNTGNRFYLSRWLESVILKYCKSQGWRAEKPYDKGAKIKSKSGKEIWVKTGYSRAGVADLMCIIQGTVYNVEVKVGKDKASEAQLKEKVRAEANGEKYVIVKTLQEFWELVDKVNIR
jgi:hypothetical protein